MSCPSCELSTVEYAETTEDDQTRLRCTSCAHLWLHRPIIVVPAAPPARTARRTRTLTLDEAKAYFPTEDDLTDATRTRVANLKQQFLARQPATDSRVGPYFARYRQIFSADGLPAADPADLKEFANNSIGAHPGNMSVFNRYWNSLGDQAAAQQLRGVIDYLLRGADEAVEDRLETLINPRNPKGMTGFRESLLTRVLCVIHPDRFLPILTYTSAAGGKREVAATVFGLELPAPERTSMTTGRLVFWSNDLLLKLCGPGFVDVAHASEFLWWAKDES
ncbi:hypothetical protein [Pseudonocardia xishanensis]|uniref:hypothetical protein n=1 Tax=Pseudonocardia xishanensis TaxID=630995 RepID=UPI0031E6C7A9